MPYRTTTLEPEQYARAVLNILDDLSVESRRLSSNQAAILNILDDFSQDKVWLEQNQASMLNILDDFSQDKVWLEQNKASMLNILEDFGGEKDEVQAANEELQQFAYIASHDLQEPLRMISSYLQLLERRYKGQLDESADQFIHFAVDGARRLQEMINGLLACARVQSRGQPFQRVDADDLLENVLRNLSLEIAETDAIVESDSLPEIQVDPQQMTQVFQNLLANAIKFRREGVRPKIAISVRETGNDYIFTVRDNGVGLEPQYREQIFVMFRRLHGKDVPGTGIGLAVCKRVIERHRGRIWVDSEPASGSAFQFAIPKRQKGVLNDTDTIKTGGQAN